MAMLAGFPPIIQSVSKIPILVDLLHVYRHMIVCAQSQHTICKRLNWLFLVVQKHLWDMYVVDTLLEPYPNSPGDPGPLPNYEVVGTKFDMARARDTHTVETKNFQKDVNMNRAPTKRFYP